jgi:WD40 repeat protein
MMTKWITRNLLNSSVALLILAVIGVRFAEPETNSPALPLIRELSTAREITAFGMLQSGVSHLAWSPDGERLAAYVSYGLAIKLWSPDGHFEQTLHRYNSMGLDSFVLGFLGGHSRLVTSPAAASSSRDDEDKIRDVAFSVMDADSGSVIANIPGPNPGKTASRDNIAVHMAISPDERFAAVVFRKNAAPRVIVYATDSWNQIVALDVGENLREPGDLAFSPDGELLAVAADGKRPIRLFETKSWALVRTIEAFPDPAPPMDIALVSAVKFSPDGSMIAVASSSGGTWTNPRRHIEFPADPLRIFNVSDGGKVSSLGSFPGGFQEGRLGWLPDRKGLIFLDAINDIRVWNYFESGPSRIVGAIQQANSMEISPTIRELAVSYPGGIKLFDLTRAME